MTEHDPLCLYQGDGYGDSCEICRLITEVRADEQERITMRARSTARRIEIVRRLHFERIARRGMS